MTIKASPPLYIQSLYALTANEKLGVGAVAPHPYLPAVSTPFKEVGNPGV